MDEDVVDIKTFVNNAWKQANDDTKVSLAFKGKEFLQGFEQVDEFDPASEFFLDGNFYSVTGRDGKVLAIDGLVESFKTVTRDDIVELYFQVGFLVSAIDIQNSGKARCFTDDMVKNKFMNNKEGMRNTATLYRRMEKLATGM